MQLLTFNDAVSAVQEGRLKCGAMELFILKLLAYPTDIKQKADVMIQILDFGNKINVIISRINSWKLVYEQLEQCQMLKQTIGLTLRFGMLLNQQQNIMAFSLSALLKLFEFKSTIDREKTAYHFVMKEYLKLHQLEWHNLPSEIVTEVLIQEIKNLVPQERIVEQLTLIDR